MHNNKNSNKELNKAMAKTKDGIDSTVKLLGKEADYLLNHKCRSVSKKTASFTRTIFY